MWQGKVETLSQASLARSHVASLAKTVKQMRQDSIFQTKTGAIKHTIQETIVMLSHKTSSKQSNQSSSN
jgi:hypothetical protein